MVTNNKFLSSVASCVFHNAKIINDDITAVFGEMSQNGTYPAVYFPNPAIMNYKSTLDSYQLDVSWYIKIFAYTTEDAFEIANNIQLLISDKRFKIPILQADGTDTGKYIKVYQCDIKEIDSHTYQLTLSWRQYIYYADVEIENKDVVTNVTMNISKKGFAITYLIDENGNVLTTEKDKLLIG